MSTARMPKLLWLLPLSSVLLLSLPACETPSPRLASLPPKSLQIPPPPVMIGPQHTKRELPVALDYSKRVSTWLDELQQLTMPAQPK